MNMPAHRVDLPHTREAFLQVLRWGALGDASPYSHRQIAEWCDRFWCEYLDDDAPADIEPLLPILTSVETQWDLYLANTYSIDELRTRSFEEVRLPGDWFEEWIAQALATSVNAKGGESCTAAMAPGFTDLELIAALEGSGTPWQKFFVLDGKLPAYENERGQLMVKIIEDDELARAVCAFLAHQGK